MKNYSNRRIIVILYSVSIKVKTKMDQALCREFAFMSLECCSRHFYVEV